MSLPTNKVSLVCYPSLMNPSMPQLFRDCLLTLSVLEGPSGFELGTTIDEFEKTCPNIAEDAITVKEYSQKKIWNKEWVKSFTLVLTNQGREFNCSLNEDGTAVKEYDWIWVKILKSYRDNVIAKNKAERTRDSVFYIQDSVQEAATKTKHKVLMAQTIAEIEHMIPEELYMLASAIGKQTRSKSISEVKETLFDFIDKSATNLTLIREYITDKERLAIEATINRSVEYRVVVKINGAYTYDELYMGASLAETVSFLREPKNQNVRLAIEGKLNEVIKELK